MEEKKMSRREYVWTFFDIDGDYTTLLNVKNLSEHEWQIKANKHNIDILNNRFKKNEKPKKEKGVELDDKI